MVVLPPKGLNNPGTAWGSSTRKGGTIFKFFLIGSRLYSTSLVDAIHKESQPGSTKTSEDVDRPFWRQVNSSKLDDNNPFYLANRFLKDYPYYNLVISNLTCSIINSILSNQFKEFKLSPADFYNLMKILPIKIELPVDSKDFVEIGGKYTRGAQLGKVGVYRFINKNNGFCYIGSSISLANILSTGYFGPKLGNRVIDLAIKDTGLDQFFLELPPWGMFIIPLSPVGERGEGENNFI